ncbi:hypothetical protein ALC53_08091 [Atta colombica]|uniref:Uncharacterized protein n=1 Tax=Atta colombica TaxID=520822 RepID=A0A151I2N3_9HYME|nr:hypothetical protein ALC53_08091 [Atta colombica]
MTHSERKAKRRLGGEIYDRRESGLEPHATEPDSLKEETVMGLKENDTEEDRDEEDRVSKEEKIIVWNKEIIESYTNTKVIKDEEDMDKGKRNNEEEVEDMWEELKQTVVNNIVKKKVKKKKKCIEYKDW